MAKELLIKKQIEVTNSQQEVILIFNITLRKWLFFASLGECYGGSGGDWYEWS